MLRSSIKEVHQALRNKSVTVQEILKDCMKKAHDITDLNAFVKITGISAEQAEESEKHFSNGTFYLDQNFT